MKQILAAATLDNFDNFFFNIEANATKLGDSF